jgi:hypothetical protein
MAGNNVTYGGRRASLQLLERNATPACDGSMVSLKLIACFDHPMSISMFPVPVSHDRISSPVPRPLPPHQSVTLQYRERCTAYSKEGDGDNDAPVLRAGELVDGVADVAGVRLGGTATANACRCLSFRRHIGVFLICDL